MSRNFLTAAFAASISLAALATTQAAPIAPLAAPGATSGVILVEGGCGPGNFRDRFGRCRLGGPVVVAPPVIVERPPVIVERPPVIVERPVIVGAPVVCGRGFRWHTGFRRCVAL